MKTILALAGDRGGWNALEPCLRLACDDGHRVRTFLVATCAKQYHATTLTTDPRIEVLAEENGVSHGMRPLFAGTSRDLVVVASSQSEEGTIASFEALSESRETPRIGVEDMYGSIIPTLRVSDAANMFAFNRVCVIDEVAREMIAKAYPTITDSVVVTGGPQFDKTLGMRSRLQELRTTLRSEMNVNEEHTVFLVVGDLVGTSEILDLLTTAIRQVGIDSAKIILRAHPRAEEREREVARRYLEESEHSKMFVDPGRALAPTSDDLLPAADVVLSAMSTTCHNAILLEMPGTVYVGTPACRALLLAEKGLDKTPEVMAGAGWQADTPEDMTRIIKTLLGARDSNALLRLKATQRSIAGYNDGRAAERVYMEMKKLMET